MTRLADLYLCMLTVAIAGCCRERFIFRANRFDELIRFDTVRDPRCGIRTDCFDELISFDTVRDPRCSVLDRWILHRVIAGRMQGGVEFEELPKGVEHDNYRIELGRNQMGSEDWEHGLDGRDFHSERRCSSANVPGRQMVCWAFRLPSQSV